MLKELHDDRVSSDDVAELAVRPLNDLDVVAIRRMLIGVAQCDRQIEKVRGIMNAVVSTYQDEIVRFERERSQLREQIERYVKLNGPVALPDVGTAYLQSQPAKIAIVDNSAARQWAKKQGYTKAEPDVTGAKKALLQAGELPPDESGLAFVPESEVLAVRWRA